jgi:aminopeptidase N
MSRHDGEMSRLRRCLSIVVLIFAAPFAWAEAPFAFATTPGALPKDVVPLEYDLHVVPDLADKRFRGSQTIRIRVLRATRQIVMNGLNMTIASASLRGPAMARMNLDAPRIDADRQMLVFALPRVLPPGRYTLAMAWNGAINTTPEGLYVDDYRSGGGERLLLATEMEPTGARRLLPCWDEPSFRARFRLTVDLPPGYSGYSNMPVTRREPLAGGAQRLAFATTPKMSSYLLALVAGEMEHVDGQVDGTRIGIVTTTGKGFTASYALAASKEVLHFYNGYFGTRYPLPKLDNIAVPGGFGGAMENWGAIVYTESGLLVDPASSPEATRQNVYGNVAHEIAHQWFGNLVTMAWWDNLWLNEAFAQWMATKASERFNPAWRVWLESNEGKENAMDLDARTTTHPIQQTIATESEANSAFDRITYVKGSAFLRMLETYLGEVPFRDGIRAYLARHRYSNTTGADLWAALTAASDKPVAAIASDWTGQSGFPLISVDARCESGQRLVTLEQQQFRFGAGEPGAERTWKVPVQVGTAGSGATAWTLLSERAATLVLKGCDEPLLLDPGNVGFFRVRYAPPLFDSLAARWPQLPDSARLKLLSDTSALVRADQARLASYFELLLRVRDEPRLAVWSRVIADLRVLDRLCAGEPSRAPLHRFAVRLMAQRFAQLGWDEKPGETVEDRQLRGRLASALADYDDAATIAEGRARFARFAADPASLAASLVDPVLHIAGQNADAATWDALKAMADRALTTEAKFRYYRALVEARDPALADRSLQLATGAEVPQLVRNGVVSDVAKSGHLDAAWAYARDHADALLADVTHYAGGRYLARIVETSADPMKADELEAFVKARLPAGALLEALRTADEIRTRARLKARLLSQLDAALSAQ